MNKYLRIAAPTFILFFMPWMHRALYLDLVAAWPDVYEPHFMVLIMQLFGGMVTFFIWSEIV